MHTHLSDLDHRAESLATGAPSTSAPRSFFVRYFFVAMAAVTFLVALTGFVPSYQAMATGELKPHWFAHVHGAIMTSWLLLFLTQTFLAAKGQLRFHRRLGIAGAALGVVVWISMGIALFRFTFAGRWPVENIYYDILLQGLLGMVAWGWLFVWALAVRKKDLATHKRLLLLATVMLVQAAIDRMHWLPGLYATVYTKFLYGDLLILPLFIYDAVTLRRVHPATWYGTAIIVGIQVITSIFWASSAWHQFWFDLFNSLR
jgi:hypothetical protein